MPERARPFGTTLARETFSTGAFRFALHFSSPTFFARSDFPSPTICPQVSKDGSSAVSFENISAFDAFAFYVLWRLET